CSFVTFLLNSLKHDRFLPVNYVIELCAYWVHFVSFEQKELELSSYAHTCRDCTGSIAHCPLPIVHCPLSIVLCPLSFVHCPLSIVLCPLSFVLCPLSFVHCPLSIVLCPLSFVHCPLI